MKSLQNKCSENTVRMIWITSTNTVVPMSIVCTYIIPAAFKKSYRVYINCPIVRTQPVDFYPPIHLVSPSYNIIMAPKYSFRRHRPCTRHYYC